MTQAERLLKFKCLNVNDFFANKVSYQTYNDIVGVLDCAKMEIYRRLVAKYEDAKVEENGDVKPYEK